MRDLTRIAAPSFVARAHASSLVQCRDRTGRYVTITATTSTASFVIREVYFSAGPLRYASRIRVFNSTPMGVQFDFVWLPARTMRHTPMWALSTCGA